VMHGKPKHRINEYVDAAGDDDGERVIRAMCLIYAERVYPGYVKDREDAGERAVTVEAFAEHVRDCLRRGMFTVEFDDVRNRVRLLQAPSAHWPADGNA
jgi:hypothetical protein